MEVEAPNKTLKKKETLSKEEDNDLCCASYISL
jgi:hypothetical protein